MGYASMRDLALWDMANRPAAMRRPRPRMGYLSDAATIQYRVLWATGAWSDWVTSGKLLSGGSTLEPGGLKKIMAIDVKLVNAPPGAQLEYSVRLGPGWLGAVSSGPSNILESNFSPYSYGVEGVRIRIAGPGTEGWSLSYSIYVPTYVFPGGGPVPLEGAGNYAGLKGPAMNGEFLDTGLPSQFRLSITGLVITLSAPVPAPVIAPVTPPVAAPVATSVMPSVATAATPMVTAQPVVAQVVAPATVVTPATVSTPVAAPVSTPAAVTATAPRDLIYTPSAPTYAQPDEPAGGWSPAYVPPLDEAVEDQVTAVAFPVPEKKANWIYIVAGASVVLGAAAYIIMRK